MAAAADRSQQKFLGIHEVNGHTHLLKKIENKQATYNKVTEERS